MGETTCSSSFLASPQAGPAPAPLLVNSLRMATSSRTSQTSGEMCPLYPGISVPKANKSRLPTAWTQNCFPLPSGRPSRLGRSRVQSERLPPASPSSSRLLGALVPMGQHPALQHTQTPLCPALCPPNTALGRKTSLQPSPLRGPSHRQADVVSLSPGAAESGWSVKEGRKADPGEPLASTSARPGPGGHLARTGWGHCSLCPKVSPELTCVSTRVCVCTHECAMCIVYCVHVWCVHK